MVGVVGIALRGFGRALKVIKGKAKRKVLYKPTKTKEGKEELMGFRDEPGTVYKGYKKRFGKDKTKTFFPDYKVKKEPKIKKD